MLHAVIMAGGSGTRFWPASRAALPKQMLNLVGDRTMLQATRDRLTGLISSDRTLVVTNQRLTDSVREQLPHVPVHRIIGEPCKRDTAPCIALAAALIQREDDDAVMVVMPADHVIRDESSFRDAVQQAEQLIQQDPGRIVTFGIRPTYPAETFGYIERSDAPLGSPSGPDIYPVLRFREKPHAQLARQFLDAGNFYWNSGIFVWKAATILQALGEYEPDMVAHVNAICAAVGSPDFETLFQREFSAIQGKSIDYAVMERYTNVSVIEAPFDWDDVGNWTSLQRLHGTDSQGNTSIGKHLTINTKGSIIRNQSDHLVVAVDLEDCIIVHTPDATLVANRNSEESIRQVVQLLEEKNWTEFL